MPSGSDDAVGHRPEARPGRTAVPPLRPDLPGPRVGRPAGRLHPTDPAKRPTRDQVTAAEPGSTDRTHGMSPAGSGHRPRPPSPRPRSGSSISTVWCGSPVNRSGRSADAVAALRARGSGWCSPPTTPRPPPTSSWPDCERIGIESSADDLATSAGGGGLAPRARASGSGCWPRAGSSRAWPPGRWRPWGRGRRGGLDGRRGRMEPVVRLRLAGRHGHGGRGSRVACSPPTRTPPIRRPDGLMPGSGALLAAVATASGVTPEIAGKPHRAMAAPDAGALRLRRRATPRW